MKKNNRHEKKYNASVLKNFTNINQSEVLKELNIEQFGLTKHQVESRREKFGENIIRQKKFNYFFVFLKSFFSPFNIILLAIDAYNFWETFLNKNENEKLFVNLFGAIIILIMVLISGTISFFQEIKTHLIIKKMTSDSIIWVKAIRDVSYKYKHIDNSNSVELIHDFTKIAKEELVNGDLIYLTNGDIIPVDCKIIWSNNLYVDQSSLTGESFPILKINKNQNSNYLEFTDICYTGTIVTSGSALAVVIATGEQTYVASIKSKVSEKRQNSSFEKGIKKIILLLILFMLFVTPLVLAIYGIKTNDWIKATMIAVTVAVGITPEMLPIILTLNLSYGYKKVKSKNILVKNLASIQNIGAIDILCTDKTGTITSGDIKLSNIIDSFGKNIKNIDEKLYLNAFFQTGFQNPIDQAILISKSINIPNINEYKKCWEIPFDFNRKILTVVIEKNNKKEVISKGSLDEILQISTKVLENNQIVELTNDRKNRLKEIYKDFGLKGYRIVGIAGKELENDDIEEELIFYGFATFFDEPKKTSKKIIKSLEKLGIKTKILTGDNEIITKAICDRVNFKIEGLLSGQDIDRMDDEYLLKVVETTNVFVKLSPLHKAKIINVLKNKNKVVGFMGDGINDAPVLRTSDIAISFSDASNIAQDSADMILLDDDLMTIKTSVIEGRKCLANILKYIKITMASNFGNVMSIIVALFLINFQPMKPIHLLLQNLIYDLSQFALIFDKVDKEFIAKPRKLQTNNLIIFTLINGFVSSIFDVLTFIILIYAFKIGLSNTNTNQEIFNSCWFFVSLLTQVAVVNVYRTAYIPFFKKCASWQVYSAMGLILIFDLLIVLTPINELFDLVIPPWQFILIAFTLVVCYIVSADLVKFLYIKIFKGWL